jgi:SSS family solute:Na+ symporter
LLHHGLALPQGAQRGIHGGWIAVLHHPPSQLHFNIGTAVLAFLVSMVVTAVVSLFTSARPQAEPNGLAHSLLAQEPAITSWWKRPEFLAIAILLAATAVCAVFV